MSSAEDRSAWPASKIHEANIAKLFDAASGSEELRASVMGRGER